MKTKQIPAIVMLTAGFAMCIISFVNDYSISFFIPALLLVLVVFFLMGCIIKVVLDRNMTKLDDDITAEDLGFADGEIFKDMEIIEEDHE